MSRLARIVAPALARARIVAPALARARIVAPALALLAVPFVPAQAATEVEVVTSPGGIVAWLVEEPSIPMVAMEISFKGGASREPDERVGVTHFLSTMLDEGAGELDSAAFSARADQLAMRYGFEAGRDSFTVSARMLSETREDSVELLRSALVEPRFDPEPLERMRASILSTLRDQATDPQAILARTWRERLFGDDPYARPMEGTPESVAAITADDLRAARERALNRSRLAIGVVGDITAEELGPLLDRLLGDLPAEPWEPLGPAELSSDRDLTVVPFDIPQSSAAFVQEGLARDDPDFIPAYVMNHILGGGGFSSRLTEEVREKRGLTYGVYSYLAPYDRAALMAGGVASSNDRVAEAIEVIRGEWARMREAGVTEEELDEAKRYLTGAYPLRFDSNAKIAGQLAGLMEEGFTPVYLEERNALIEAVTVDDVARVAQRLLHPEALMVTVIGEPEGLPEAERAPPAD